MKINQTANCKIVLPWYKNELTNDELWSIKCLKKHLFKYPLHLVVPQGLTVDSKLLEGLNYDITFFDKKYFKSAKHYNQLLVEESFYDTFSDYDYILIYQFDVLIFKDNLDYWCQLGYDYIGSPWYWISFGIAKKYLNKPFFSAGNGGLSLRKVKSHITTLQSTNKTFFRERVLIEKERQKIEFWRFFLKLHKHHFFDKKIARTIKEYCDNQMIAEDTFWALAAKEFNSDFKVADWRTSLSFAFESNPRELYEINGRQLPFGAHAWWQYDRDFYLENCPDMKKECV